MTALRRVAAAVGPVVAGPEAAGKRIVASSTLWVLMAALAIRAGVLIIGSDSLANDPDAYARLAVQWSESGVLGFESADGRTVRPTAFRPPLYPWLLSFLVADGKLWLGGVALLHLALGLASVWLTLSIGRRLQLRWGPWAALAVALDPLLLRASQLVMTETLATFGALVAWRIWLGALPVEREEVCSRDRFLLKRWVGLGSLGIALGLSILARPTAAPWAAMCVLGLNWVGCSCWKRRMAGSGLAAFGVLVCLAPWSLRNLAQLGKPIWATTHGGYTLLLANNPTLYQHFTNNGPSRAWDAESFHAAWAERRAHEPAELLQSDYWLPEQVESPAIAERAAERDPPAAAVDREEGVSAELADDALAYAAARATIQRQPGMFIVSSIIRVGWLWALWPNESLQSPRTLAVGGWYALGLTLAALGLRCVWRSGQWRGWLPGLLLLLSLTAIHAVYWSNMRMRSPAMPVVYLLAVRRLDRPG